MNKAILSTVAAAIVGLNGAWAFPATMKYLGGGGQKGGSVKYTFDGGANFREGRVGELRVELKYGSVEEILYTYCVDPFVGMATSHKGVNVLDTGSLSPNGMRIGDIVNQFAPTVRASGNDNDAKAMQLVVWELLFETGNVYDITAGSFFARRTNGNPLESSIVNAANSYLAANGADLAIYIKSNLNSHGDPLTQSVVAPVPEPASLIALSVGLVGLARRRISKK